MVRRTSSDIRNESRFAVLRDVTTQVTVTRPGIAQATGLSVATVNTLVEELVRQEVLQEAGRISSRGGRPITTFQVNAHRGLLVGVDVAETYLEVDLFDIAFARLGHRQLELSTDVRTPEDVVARIRGAIDELLAAHQGEDLPLLGTGVSLPGQVDPTRGVDIFAPNWGWHDVHVLAALDEALDGPVWVDNPLKALAYCELWFGQGREVDDLVVLNLGTGVGAGIVIGGEVLRGAGNSAGEWGHTTLIWGGRECGCGRSGCVEAYVGVEGIRRTLAEQQTDHPLLSVQHHREFIEQLMRAEVAGDEAARTTMQRTGDYLAAGIGNLVNMFNPDHISVRGWITSYAGGGLRERIRERIGAESLPGPLATVTVDVPDDERTVALGMAVLAFEGFMGSVGLPSSSSVRTMPEVGASPRRKALWEGTGRA
jgi:predicted NBD/HSP70 family sugar kinase